MEGTSPTYRARAFDAAGQEILAREFTVHTVSQPYNGVIPRYEQEGKSQVTIAIGALRSPEARSIQSAGLVLISQS